ncbi:hypothetical protein LTR66_000570 [Elasticomyces elasticus]|nr:hypothetical protein LTR66_000570 [Elasticomyces elasticus]KAK5011017.1 hypothetical protein LTR28_006293 [Elasticomyces elasticus]
MFRMQCFHVLARSSTKSHRWFSSRPIDAEALLSKRTWSVRSLLPSTDTTPDSPQVSSEQLHHLLRLSALPPPKDPSEEARMLRTLSSQLHFVREIQAVDTTGVSPLRTLRDETTEGEQRNEIGLAELKDALCGEDAVGKHHKRVRRRRDQDGQKTAAETWHVLGSAEKLIGKYFVVEGGK